MNNYDKKLEELLETTIKQQASDLHLSVGWSPTLRISGRLVPLLKKKKLSAKDTKGLAQNMMSAEELEKLLEKKEIDFSYHFKDKARFRVNVFFQRENVSCALRLICVLKKTV